MDHHDHHTGDRAATGDLPDDVSLEPTTASRRQRGEGIVSVAIAVLIMAALGVVAYGAFDALFQNTTDAAETQIGNIGG